MSKHYNINYTEEEITSVLDRIKNCVQNDKFNISLNKNRQDNINFIEEYNIRSERRKEILLNIEVRDFSHSLNNTNKGYEHEVLYVFGPEVKLHNVEDVEDVVTIYIKFNIIERVSGDYTITISFHKAKEPLTYVFR